VSKVSQKVDGRRPLPEPIEAPEPWHKRRSTWTIAAVAMMVLLFAFMVTPEKAREVVHVAGVTGPSPSEDLFQNATTILHRLEQINSPDVMQQVVGGYNQWLEDQGSAEGWKPDPLLGSIPTKYAIPRLSEFLAAPLLFSQDAIHLEESIVMRDIARAAGGEQIDDLARAVRLFDWTVRNMQLDPLPKERTDWRTFQPMRLLEQGHGNALQRTWIFLLLARQQQLDVVVLAMGDPDKPDELRTWAPALLSGGELYVFDPSLGIAIPGPAGDGVATLSQLAADDALLRRLDLNPELQYPIEAGDLARVTAFVEARPLAMSRRMQLIEKELAGEQKVVLTASPSRVRELLQACPQVAATRIWPFPFEEAEVESRLDRAGDQETIDAMADWMLPNFAQPMLPMGRKYHFKGNFTGEHGEPGEASANGYYQACLLADDAMKAQAQKQAEEGMNEVAPHERQAIFKKIFESFGDALRRAMHGATYWLGVIAYERGKYETAIDYFKVRTLEKAPESFFVPGARFNLARCYEATGQIEEAIKVYKSDDSEMRYGNLLRARWLREKSPLDDAAAPAE